MSCFSIFFKQNLIYVLKYIPPMNLSELERRALNGNQKVATDLLRAQNNYIRATLTRQGNENLDIGPYTPPLTLEQIMYGHPVVEPSEIDGEAQGGKLNLKKAVRQVSKALKPVGKAAAKEGKQFAKDVLKPAGRDILSALKSKATEGVANASQNLTQRINDVGVSAAPAVAVPIDDSKSAEGGKINIKKAFRQVAKALKPVGKAVAKEGNQFAKDVLKPAGQDVLNALKSKAQEGIANASQSLTDQINNIGAEAPLAAEAGKMKKKRQLSAALQRRNAIVKQVKDKHPGMTLPEASKFVKDHGLYK
jgi:hypothetical protein